MAPNSDTSRPRPPGPFVDLEELKNAEGLVAVISQRRATGVLTFAFFRDFERDGQIDRTSFIAEAYCESFMQLAQATTDRIAELRGNAAKLAELQAKAGFTPIPRTDRGHAARRHGGR